MNEEELFVKSDKIKQPCQEYLQNGKIYKAVPVDRSMSIMLCRVYDLYSGEEILDENGDSLLILLDSTEHHTCAYLENSQWEIVENG